MALSPKQLADKWTAVTLAAPGATKAGLEKAAAIVETEAKRVIGTYEYGWPRLSPKTVKRKGADTPLYETGELQDSIETWPINEGDTGIKVGSTNPKAMWHEFGTVHIPARSFLKGAAMRKSGEIAEVIGNEFKAIMQRPGEAVPQEVGSMRDEDMAFGPQSREARMPPAPSDPVGLTELIR